jgi:hypothetical protein
MNYFNYFTEIEEEFVKRRGSHMLVSPLDWSLIETWKQRGIPLHIVLRGINSSFDGYDKRPNRGRKVNSLFFCQQEVEAVFQEYVESRVGSNGGGSAETGASNGDGGSPFSQSTVMEFLKERRDVLLEREAAHAGTMLQDTFARTAERLTQIIEDLEEPGGLSSETLETDLVMIEEVILDGLKEHYGEDRLGELRSDCDAKLRGYRQNMEPEIYRQTLDNFVARRLRDHYRVPRLSLFYL